MESTKTNEKRERLADCIYKLDPFHRIEANLIYYFKLFCTLLGTS